MIKDLFYFNRFLPFLAHCGSPASRQDRIVLLGFVRGLEKYLNYVLLSTDNVSEPTRSVFRPFLGTTVKNENHEIFSCYVNSKFPYCFNIFAMLNFE